MDAFSSVVLLEASAKGGENSDDISSLCDLRLVLLCLLSLPLHLQGKVSLWSLPSPESKRTRGCREDSNMAIYLVVPASSIGLLESWNLACSPGSGCEASGSHSASKLICKQQLPQGHERISRRPGMTNDSHADSGFLFYCRHGCFSCYRRQ